MSDIELAAAQSTPAVKANAAAGTLEMRGDSYPENSFEFFAPIVKWVGGYLEEQDTPLKVELHLLYLNTSSVRAMMDIFDMLEDAFGDGREVSVAWYYDADNERIAELAEEFKEDCTFPFKIVLGDA
ncbi:DUF1987 domain-containing protein [bacterium]|nr:MAG: DUF1987 domain-containing protein [bacterium]